jgi:hypothetical protein
VRAGFPITAQFRKPSSKTSGAQKAGSLNARPGTRRRARRERQAVRDDAIISHSTGWDRHQVSHCTLAALAGEFKPMILVNPRGALGLDAERSNQAQSFDQLRKIARRCCISSLP